MRGLYVYIIIPIMQNTYRLKTGYVFDYFPANRMRLLAM